MREYDRGEEAEETEKWDGCEDGVLQTKAVNVREAKGTELAFDERQYEI